ncbi:MAG: sulfur reduction protein DsrE [Candidatus Thioglobus sp.]|nr:MAG: sulfur reduction protein DsrE [Candidatus Thioglobus sp.]RUM79753.1 MAG: sulfur reduction protein DsrE [Candidatus Thioglobus sp.]RUM84753.1 MAG: sulfur reduction protein DsrE [Candidatus Thioglobus sp.]
MRLGMVVYSNDPETVFNAFRLGVFSLGKGDTVKAFLLAKGVESEMLVDDKFNVLEQMQSFVDAGGEVFACGTCLKIRKSGSSDMCPMSTLDDLHGIIAESDKVLTF